MECRNELNFSRPKFEQLLQCSEQLRNQVWREGLIHYEIERDLDKETLIKLGESINRKVYPKKPFIEWNFGALMELEVQKDAKNYLYSYDNVPFHWDGAFHEVPGILLFYCIEGCSSGQTLFCDTTKLIESLSPEDLKRLETTKIKYYTEKIIHYGGEFSQNALTLHPVTNEPVLRLGEEVSTRKNPVSRQIMDEFSIDLINEIGELLYSSDFMVEHRWRAGDLLLVDNHRFLHGRRPIKAESKRKINRLQLR